MPQVWLILCKMPVVHAVCPRHMTWRGVREGGLGTALSLPCWDTSLSGVRLVVGMADCHWERWGALKDKQLAPGECMALFGVAVASIHNKMRDFELAGGEGWRRCFCPRQGAGMIVCGAVGDTHLVLGWCELPLAQECCGANVCTFSYLMPPGKVTIGKGWESLNLLLGMSPTKRASCDRSSFKK